jgi:hypothetical protein
MDKEEVTHLERMISLHKKNLYLLEEMLAKYGADQPLHLINSVTMEREAMASRPAPGNSKNPRRWQACQDVLISWAGKMKSRPFCSLYSPTAERLLSGLKELEEWGNPRWP